MGNTHNFEKALENLENLKKLSFDKIIDQEHQTMTAKSDVHHRSEKIKEALNGLQGYVQFARSLPKQEADKGLKQLNFLFSGVQNVSSFLEEKDTRLYHVLEPQFFELNQTYNHTQTALNQALSEINSQNNLPLTTEDENYQLNSLVEIKRDKVYELFYLSDEKNHKFYSETLIQIINKQEKVYESVHEGDPLTKAVLWNIEAVDRLVRSILMFNDVPIRLFYQKAFKYLHEDSVSYTHNALMALFLSRSSASTSKTSAKSNIHYFTDFILFLRNAWDALLLKTELQEDYDRHSYALISSLSISLFQTSIVFEQAEKFLYFQIKKTVHLDEDKKLNASQYLSEVYEELHRFLSQYPNGPLFKAIDKLADAHMEPFDPIMLGMLPSLEGVLRSEYKKIDVIRSPSPISQSSVAYAHCNQEFLEFLQTKTQLQTKVLVLNIQNRLSWKDRARTRVIEESIEQTENKDYISVCSFPEPEEFLQLIEQHYGEQETFKDFFSIVYSEFQKPQSISLWLIPKHCQEKINIFLNSVLPLLKEVFFSKKKILFKNDKILLLHIISYLIIFKLIEIMDPDSLMVITKDGLDYASIFIGGFAFFAQDSGWDEHQLKLFISKILTPTLVARDRLIFSNHIELLSKFINCLRKNRQNLHLLKTFFHFDIEGWRLSNYMNEFTEVSDMHSLLE